MPVASVAKKPDQRVWPCWFQHCFLQIFSKSNQVVDLDQRISQAYAYAVVDSFICSDYRGTEERYRPAAAADFKTTTGQKAVVCTCVYAALPPRLPCWSSKLWWRRLRRWQGRHFSGLQDHNRRIGLDQRIHPCHLPEDPGLVSPAQSGRIPFLTGIRDG